MGSNRLLMSIIVHLILFLLHNLYPIEGTMRFLSDEENLELDKELASLNKPAVRTVRTVYGDIYDCVDLYKQPALDHPFLQDHKIQLRPSFAQKTNVSTARASRPSSTSIQIGLDDECPSGTVPIRRTTREELSRAKNSFREHFQSPYRVNEEEVPKLLFAGISTAPRQDTVYYGAAGHINICNPTVELGQLSASVISIEAGPVSSFSTIRVGWMVNINLFQDNHTRLYTIWGQGIDGVMQGCYNTYCSGFVQTDTRIPLGMVLDPVSVVRGPQYYFKLAVHQDKDTGNWWLTYSELDTPVGYWSKNLFTYLKDGAEALNLGGMVYSSTPKVPPMGNGDNGDLHSCHFRLVELQYEEETTSNGSKAVPIDVIQTKCYKAGENSYKDDYWGYNFYYGGNGGDVNECSQRKT